MESTRREQIKHTLLQAPYTLEAIKQIFQISIHTAYEDIQHIEKSCKNNTIYILNLRLVKNVTLFFNQKRKFPHDVQNVNHNTYHQVQCNFCQNNNVIFAKITMQLLSK